jgi:hypothetical protein
MLCHLRRMRRRRLTICDVVVVLRVHIACDSLDLGHGPCPNFARGKVVVGGVGHAVHERDVGGRHLAHYHCSRSCLTLVLLALSGPGDASPHGGGRHRWSAFGGGGGGRRRCGGQHWQWVADAGGSRSAAHHDTGWDLDDADCAAGGGGVVVCGGKLERRGHCRPPHPGPVAFCTMELLVMMPLPPWCVCVCVLGRLSLARDALPLLPVRSVAGGDVE